MNEKVNPVVAHVMWTYLFLTGSWIHQQIIGHKWFDPIVITNNLQNLGTFPFPKEKLYRYTSPIHGNNLVLRGLNRIFQSFTSHQIRYYINVLSETRVQVMHAHFGTEGYRLIPVKQVVGIPLITTFYGYDMSRLPQIQPKWKKRYLKLFENGDLFLCEGAHMAGQLEKLGCPTEKIIVHHLGVDIDRIQFKHRRLEKGEIVRLLLTASFTEKKGIPFAIKAFAKALSANDNMNLTIIGGVSGSRKEEELYHECLKLITEYGINDKVTILGYLPYGEYLNEMNAAHIFLHPSVTASDGDTEGGAPVSVIEASASGMPVISSFHCDIPGVVIHRKTGLLAEERNVDQIAAAILEITSDPAKWIEMGSAGRHHIELEYSAKIQAQRLEEIYCSTINDATERTLITENKIRKTRVEDQKVKPRTQKSQEIGTKNTKVLSIFLETSIHHHFLGFGLLVTMNPSHIHHCC
jgi:colanic acid/amylovoran biosynthesis glycosyltransferase